MRLASDEIAAITDCAADVFGRGAVVRLFGSRVRDDLTGGDIDLHVVPESDDLATLAHEDRFRAGLQSRLGEQRIDIVVKGPGTPARPIDRVAQATGRVLVAPATYPPDDAAAGLEDGAIMQAYLDMLDEAVRAGRIVTARLSGTLAVLQPRLPFTAETIADLDETGAMATDSLLMQFGNLVALVQDQLIRGILLAAEEHADGRSRIDQRHMAEKLGALPAGLDIPAVIRARNRIAHQYPAHPAKQAEIINQVVQTLPTALAAYEALAAYAARQLAASGRPGSGGA